MLQEERDRYLNTKIDATMLVKDAPGVNFVSYLLKKVNGMNAMDPRVAEINALSQAYPGRNLSDDNKIEWLQKLEALGIIL